MRRALSILTLAAGLLLAGCATDLYSYRGGSGDYYYGAPQSDVRIYGGGYYGYPHYGGPYRYGFPYRYGYHGFPYRYGYGVPYHYRPYYGGPYRPGWRPRHHDRREYQRRDRDGSPWRNLDEFRRARTPTPGVQDTPRPQLERAPRPRAEGDGGRFRRAAEAAVRRSGRDQNRNLTP